MKMLKTTSDPKTLYCDRCDRHVSLDPENPFYIPDGKHYCLGNKHGEQLEVTPLSDAITFSGGHQA
jgi:hypothetical protein